MNSLRELLIEYIIAWTYKDFKGIPPKLAWHHIELETSIPLVHNARFKMNPNYVVVVKQNINKLLKTKFIQHVEEATWLIVVIPKKNGKLKIYVDFRKLNVIIKKDPYPVPFIYEVMNKVVVHDVYSFLNGYSKYQKTNTRQPL